MLVNQGLDDLKLKIGDNELKCVKSLLCSQNSLFSKLLNDSLGEKGELVINSECSVESIQLLITYYGFGEIEITNKNVIDLLKTCVYYDEKKVINYCGDYILNHCDLELLINLLNCSELLNAECCAKIKEFVSKKVDETSNVLLNERNIFKLSYSSLLYILRKENISVNNESQLFNSICLWLRNEKSENIKANADNETGFEEEKLELLSYIKWKEVNMSYIKEENIEYIPTKSYNELIKSSESVHHKYKNNCCRKDDSYDPESINESIQNLSKSNDVEELIKLCSFLTYYKTDMIDSKVLLELVNSLLKVFSSLSKQDKRIVAKFLASCYNSAIDENIIIEENKEAFILIYYFKVLPLFKDSNNYKFYDEDDYDLLDKQKIGVKNYNKGTFSFAFGIGESVSIKLIDDGFASCFRCELPDGLSIDYYSGEITGIAKEIMSGDYKVYYRNPHETIITIRLYITKNDKSNKLSSSSKSNFNPDTSFLFSKVN